MPNPTIYDQATKAVVKMLETAGTNWQQPWQDFDIYVREFFAVWIAVCTWGDLWSNKQIIIFTDNEAVKDVWKKGTTPVKPAMRIIRTMFMFAAKRNFNILLQHVPGKDNILADALSRFQVQRFRTALPTADASPTVVPQAIWDL